MCRLKPSRLLRKKYGRVGEASGVSPTATIRDTVTIRLIDSQDGQNIAFFTGLGTDRRNLGVDRKEEEIVFEQGKNKSLTFQSKKIHEHRSFFYYIDGDNSRKRLGGAQLNGVIVQAWVGGERIKSDSVGDSSLKKHEELPDVVKSLGELKESSDGF